MKTPVLGSLFNKVAGPQASQIPVKFAKFLRTPSLKNTFSGSEHFSVICTKQKKCAC